VHEGIQRAIDEWAAQAVQLGTHEPPGSPVPPATPRPTTSVAPSGDGDAGAGSRPADPARPSSEG
jgi:hypothetical protein